MAGIFGIRKLKIEKKGVPNGKPMTVLGRSLKVLGEVTRETINDDSSIQALKDLYHVTEHEARKVRIQMVYQADAKLVPLLLHFLWNSICEPKSHAHSLTMVLLNNLSTEAENQRFIALNCGGVKILSNLLCEEPSCHLLAICLVNLSFSCVTLRRDWVALNKELHWMEALTFAIRIGSMTRDEYHLVQPFLEQSSSHRLTPAEHLSILRADERVRSGNGSSCFQIHETLPPTGDQLFPETVRWCLCILKNLSRPHPEITISDVVFESGIVPFLFQCITLCHVKSRSPTITGSHKDTYDVVPSPSNTSSSVALNSPENWDSTSAEDAALYVVMNLAAQQENHQKLVDLDALLLLSLVTQYAESHPRDDECGDFTPDHLRVMDFQSLKARMAMSFILGSRGHFGQPAQTLMGLETAEEKEAVLTLTKANAIHLLELLANSLHSRGKSGPGGYSAFVMSPHLVIKAIRCLLVEYKNQALFSEFTGTRLNSLLLKTMAMHVFGGKVDIETAEDAAVSLYLQSNYGFKFPFLPSIHGGIDPTRGTAARVLAAFARIKSTSAAGRYAGHQLVSRLPHLMFGSSERDASLESGNFELSDFLLSSELLKLTKQICLPPEIGGTSPRKDIDGRPLFRKRALQNGKRSQGNASIEWFPNALIAIQDQVFERIKRRLNDPLDDIEIANMVARCADGEKEEVFGYIWVWQDDQARLRTLFDASNFNPCTGQRSLSSSLLKSTVGQFEWATCGKPTVQET